MKLSKGFTLIELLIVIGVLGIMATGLLAAVDPFEQLKKARDANNRNIAIELLNAFTRYYATHGQFPWNMTPVDTACSTAALGTLAGFGDMAATGAFKVQSMNGCVTNTLIADGELKNLFFTGLGQTDIYVSSADKTHIVVCFSPEGKALRNDAITSYTLSDNGPYKIVDDGIAQGGQSGDLCPGATDGTCLQCYQ